ncbi:hypothetical protein [Shinella pollutisoli]|uniref:Uncharacterized protein n=1 Tax=Shinella pollutisoli TaxID=2250594 RepID=A0ABV7DFW4_9HYPH|nr:hypothetical protein [Shinella pollutisoli]
MTALPLAGATLLLLAGMSLFAARHVAPGARRLIMQWKWDGTPGWSLPRGAALAFMPALGAIVMAAVAFAEPDALPVVCAVLAAAHALHLLLLARRR